MEIDFYEMFSSMKTLVDSERPRSNEFIPRSFGDVIPAWYKDITAEELHILKTTNIYSPKEKISTFISILQKIIALPDFSRSSMTPLNYGPAYWTPFCNNGQPYIPNNETTETECSNKTNTPNNETKVTVDINNDGKNIIINNDPSSSIVDNSIPYQPLKDVFSDNSGLTDILKLNEND